MTAGPFILRMMRELRNDGRPERRVLIDPANGSRPAPVNRIETDVCCWILGTAR